jgi:hypothetical protein
MFYRVEVSGNEVKILEKLPDGCSEDDILIEPSDDKINASIQQAQQK